MGNKSFRLDLLSTTTSSSLGRASRDNHGMHGKTMSLLLPRFVTAWTLNVFFYFAPLYIFKTARIQCEKCCHPANYTLSHTQILVYAGQKCPNKAARQSATSHSDLFLAGLQTANFWTAEHSKEWTCIYHTQSTLGAKYANGGKTEAVVVVVVVLPAATSVMQTKLLPPHNICCKNWDKGEHERREGKLQGLQQ